LIVMAGLDPATQKKTPTHRSKTAEAHAPADMKA
jgi:hypothetical protein